MKEIIPYEILKLINEQMWNDGTKEQFIHLVRSLIEKERENAFEAGLGNF